MVLIKEVENLIKNTGEPNAAFESKTFKRKFFDLKRLRTSADYKDEDFTYDMCCESISLSDDLVPLLKRIK